MRFKVGDKSQGAEVVSIQDGIYNLLCIKCDDIFSRSISLTAIPECCTDCAKKAVSTVKGMEVRPYTKQELKFIEEYYNEVA
jgi:hypothetical protein